MIASATLYALTAGAINLANRLYLMPANILVSSRCPDVTNVVRTNGAL